MDCAKSFLFFFSPLLTVTRSKRCASRSPKENITTGCLVMDLTAVLGPRLCPIPIQSNSKVLFGHVFVFKPFSKRFTSTTEQVFIVVSGAQTFCQGFRLMSGLSLSKVQSHDLRIYAALKILLKKSPPQCGEGG